MTSSEFAREVFSIVEAKIPDRPSPTEFEMAYQSRIAMEFLSSEPLAKLIERVIFPSSQIRPEPT